MTNRGDAQRGPLDGVAEYFEERGVSVAVRKKGLRGIIAEWGMIAQNAAHYDLTLFDWMNDLDLRDIIAGALAVAPESERNGLRDALDRADHAFRAATIPATHAPAVDSSSGAPAFDPARQWWYFRYPVHPGESMRADLAAAGVMRGS
jgi:hypothetical protein